MREALIKNKNKESHNQMRIMSNNTMGFYNTKTMLFSISTIHLANTTWLMIKEGYEKKFITNRQLLQDKNGLDDDLFRLAYHYVYEFSKQHQTKIQNYVALYGFAETYV